MLDCECSLSLGVGDLVLRVAFLIFHFLVRRGAGADEPAFAFRFLGVEAAVEVPSFVVFFFPSFLGLSASTNITHISSVKGRKPETGSFL